MFARVVNKIIIICHFDHIDNKNTINSKDNHENIQNINGITNSKRKFENYFITCVLNYF